MLQAFNGYQEELQSETSDGTRCKLAWEFAVALQQEATLLAWWGGRRWHDEHRLLEETSGSQPDTLVDQPTVIPKKCRIPSGLTTDIRAHFGQKETSDQTSRACCTRKRAAIDATATVFRGAFNREPPNKIIQLNPSLKWTRENAQMAEGLALLGLRNVRVKRADQAPGAVTKEITSTSTSLHSLNTDFLRSIENNNRLTVNDFSINSVSIRESADAADMSSISVFLNDR